MRRFVVAAVMLAMIAISRADESIVQPEDFAILPWGFTSGTSETYKQIRECGFNLAGFVSPSQLDLVYQAGLKAIVQDPAITFRDDMAKLAFDEVTSRVRDVLQRTRAHPAAFGYYIRDEPDFALFKPLALWARAFREADPSKMVYINLLPNYIDPQLKAWGLKDYDEFLESYIETVEPRFLSYDHYALMDGGALRGGYFQNLESMRKAALKHNLPFWNIVLSNAHFTYAEPTPAGLRFQAFTTLAYGARGISYFTYFAPDVGNYRLAPVDQFGNKTPTWDMLRNVNLQIHKLAPVLVKLKSANVFHYPDVPDGCRDVTSSLHLASVSGEHLLIGEFEGPGKEVVAMVVNKDLHHSTAFDVKFKAKGEIRMVDPYSGRERRWEGEQKWLAAGQGMLLTLK